MSLWTQLDFILAFPLGAVIVMALCMLLATCIATIVGLVFMTRMANEANRGWRESYAAWNRLDGLIRGDLGPPDGGPDDDGEPVVDLAAYRSRLAA